MPQLRAYKYSIHYISFLGWGRDCNIVTHSYMVYTQNLRCKFHFSICMVLTFTNGLWLAYVS